MKQLFILRHSKAGQTNKKILDDHSRTLTQKGVEACTFVANYMNTELYQPDHILASTAVRAQETAQLINKDLHTQSEIENSVKLYLSSVENIYKRISITDDNIERLLVVGHNPGLQEFAITLSGSGDKKKFRAMRNNFPPRSLAVFDLKIENWSDILPQSGELKDFHIAKS